MRIVHLTSVHVWRDVRIFERMCRSLARDGHEVHLVAPRDRAAETEEADGVLVHSVARPSGRWERVRATRREIVARARAIDADLYHFHDPDLLRLMAALRERSGKPVVYDVHEDYRAQILSKSWLPTGSRHLVAWWFGRFEDRFSKALSAIVAATPHIARRFAGHPRLGAHPLCELVQNFPDLREFPSSDKETSDHDPGRFIFVGEITAIRGIREILEAVALAGSGTRLALGGPWEDPAFRDEMRRLEGWRQVEELGYLERPSVREEMARSAAGLALFPPLPNHVHSQPTKLFEYMAAGIPVIASDFPHWREIIEGAGCGLLADPTDPSDIARAMREVLDRPEEAREMGRRGRRAVVERYNWASEYVKLAALYRRIAV